MRYIFELAPWDVNEFQKELRHIEIRCDEDVETLKRLFDKYFWVCESTKEGYPFEYVINMENGMKYPEAMKKLVSVCDFKMSWKYVKIFKLVDKVKRPRKKEEEYNEDKMLNVTLSKLMDGDIQRFCDIYSVPKYVPIGLSVNYDEFGKCLSNWSPSPYFLFDKNMHHTPAFCENYNLYLHYNDVIKKLVKDPRKTKDEMLTYHPELKYLKYIFDLFFDINQDNDMLTQYFMKWVAKAFIGGDKTQIMYVFYGAPGVGKSTIIQILKHLFSNKNGGNFANLPASEVISNAARFTSGSLMKAQFCAMEELNVKKIDNDIATMLKNRITCKKFTVQLKGKNSFELTNFVNYVVTVDMLPSGLLDSKDRRIIVAESKGEMRKNHNNHLVDINMVLDGKIIDHIVVPRTTTLNSVREGMSCHKCSRCTYQFNNPTLLLLSYFFLRVFLEDPTFCPFLQPPQTDIGSQLMMLKKETDAFIFHHISLGSNHDHTVDDYKCPNTCCSGMYSKKMNHFEEGDDAWKIRCVDLWSLYKDYSPDKKLPAMPRLQFITDMKQLGITSQKVTGMGMPMILFHLPDTKKELKENLWKKNGSEHRKMVD